MHIIKYTLENPVKVLVAVLFAFLFGIQALLGMPYQLSPTVEYPTVTVRTLWPGATPYEIEREIIEPQENVLKSIPGLMEMESTASNGQGTVTLQFELGSSLMESMLEVSNKLNEVRRYPDNAERPFIRASGADASPIVFMIVELKDAAAGDIDSYRTFVLEEVVPRFERITGVAEVWLWGGRATQMHVTVMPEKLAAYGVGIERLSAVLSAENVNVSAGLLSVGRQNFRVRTVSEFQSVEDIKNTLVLSQGGEIKVSDLAEVGYGYALGDSAIRYGGNRAMMIQIIAEAGANVLNITDEVERIANEVNDTLLSNMAISLQWMYDQRPYINGAISLVKGNIMLGGILAVAVLLLFLRSVSSTLIVGTAIPISVMGTFLILNMLGRTLNVISLAGIAFAVSILIDNAVIVLENIDRHRKMDKSPMQAALDGTSEVWGAVLAATLTTVAIFLPVVFIQQEVGQLFRDIAIAISSAVTLSLFVSVLVIPVLTRLIGERLSESTPNRVSLKIAEYGGRIQNTTMRLSYWINSSVKRSAATIAILVAFSAVMVYLLFPKMEYLPQGNMNMTQSRFIIQSGLSLDERYALADMFYKQAQEYMYPGKDGFPVIEQLSYSVSPTGMFAMATAADPGRASDLVPLLSGLIRNIPGVGGATTQMGIFQNRNSGARGMEVVLSGNDIEAIARATSRLMEIIPEMMPGVQVRSLPSVDMTFPEAVFRPIPERLLASGMNPASLGAGINVYVDGRKVGEYRDTVLGNIDLIMNVPIELRNSPEELSNMLLPIAGGEVVPVSSIAELHLGLGMEQIRRFERERMFRLIISPPQDMVLQELMEGVDQRAIAQIRNDGLLDNIKVHYAGSASRLTDARNALQGNFLLALLITYLLMAALFNNFFYPLVIMFSVPMAMAGGFIGLVLVNIFIAPQSLDMLTMLGFVMLIGIVTNGAILIVHQSLNNIRMYNMDPQEAIQESVRTRLRPIAMGVATSVFGMMPLVVLSGAGSELYRGLGSVLLGGLAVSTIFTVFMIPAILSLTIIRRS